MINLDEIARITDQDNSIDFRIRKLSGSPPRYVLWTYQTWCVHLRSMEFYEKKFNEFFNNLMEALNE